MDLDEELYASTAHNFSDIRVVNEANNMEQPFLLEKALRTKQVLRERECQSKVLSLGQLPDNRLQLLVQLKEKGCKPNRLTFYSSIKNFEKSVRISGSHNQKNWRLLVEDQPIFDFQRYMDFSNLQVRFPASEFSYFKIDVGNITDLKSSPYMEISRVYKDGMGDSVSGSTKIERRDFRMEKMVFHTDSLEKSLKQTEKQSYPVNLINQRINEKEKTTEIILESTHQPISEFILETTSTNFNRQVLVQSLRINSPGNSWETISTSSIRKLDLANIHRHQMRVVFPEHREEQYRIVIQNHDNPPLHIDNVTAKGSKYRILFFGYPGQRYRIFYGNEKMQQPSYDLANILPTVRKGKKLKKLNLEAEMANPNFQESSFTFNFLNHKILLTAMIVAMVITLVWGIYHAIRKVDQLPGE